jgi:hypothetical protein
MWRCRGDAMSSRLLTFRTGHTGATDGTTSPGESDIAMTKAKSGERG